MLKGNFKFGFLKINISYDILKFENVVFIKVFFYVKIQFGLDFSSPFS